jgi:CheY-like chemotaxis protein
MEREYILIAEDDEDDRMLLTSAFRDIASKKEIVFVQNGIELVAHFGEFEKGARRNLPTLLVVDLNMPKMNGREAISEICDREYFRNFPTVIFSTTGNEIERSRCSELGIAEYIVKPSNYHTLIDVVRKFEGLSDGDSNS